MKINYYYLAIDINNQEAIYCQIIEKYLKPIYLFKILKNS